MAEKPKSRVAEALWKPILVPVSFAPSSEEALRVAFDVACRHAGSELFVLRYQSVIARMAQSARDWLTGAFLAAPLGRSLDGHPIYFRKEAPAMCDYSLYEYKNRLAQEGETLVVHRFISNTVGLISPADLQATKNDKADQSRPGFWSSLKDFFSEPTEKAMAVCVPPGARLLLDDIPARLRQKLNVREEEEVVFTQLSAEANKHRDAVRFRNGREVLLQEFKEGQRAFVISVSLPEELPEREQAVAATHYVLSR